VAQEVTVTIVMPYWERFDAAKKSLSRYQRYYTKEQVKVIIVDDGSPTQPAKPLEEVYEGCKVIQLPIKDRPLNPCVPINAGMKEADTDIVGLSNPEVLQLGPTVMEMCEILEMSEDPDNDYVVAQAWCPELNQWHAHPINSSHPDMPIPIGHFLAIFTKRFWERVGPFDEDYRYGQGYDDTDFVMRILTKQAKVVFTEHIVLHKKTGARTNWNLPNNDTLYKEKWSHVHHNLR
jgi:hypothetical protein